jgi:hypothetical protein
MSIMIHALLAALLSLGLLSGMLFSLEIGRRYGLRKIRQDPDGAKTGLGAIDGAMFGLLGLLIAFTFSGAMSRFDVRRQLIVEETNAIGTAYLRLDLLPPDRQPALRESFRRYVDSRLKIYQLLPDLEAAKKELARSADMQGEIWRQAVSGCKESPSPQAVMLLLPALNQMIDITTTRTMAGQTHPPAIVFVMLAVMALSSSALAGYGMAGSKIRSWIHTLLFSAVTALTFYVILDLEYPRVGTIRVDAFDQALADLRQSMGE